MLDPKQLNQITERGINELQITTQLDNFKTGFPYLNINTAATPSAGIKVLTKEEILSAVKSSDSFEGARVKFVPASGAATRMFKDLYEGAKSLKKGEALKESSGAYAFYKNFSKFPFASPLNLIELTLGKTALDLGEKPKGLIPFHKYENCVRTPFEEHLVEGALYAIDSNRDVNIVFTVSAEHINDFVSLFEKVKHKYESDYNCKFNVIFTTQQKNTDIIAVDMNNKPFLTEDGLFMFRPGGHGALLANLNDIDSDIIIIKNIDNVVKESLISDTVIWKKILQGRLLELKNKVSYYLELLDEMGEESPTDLLEEVKVFLLDSFSIYVPTMDNKELPKFLFNKLNRPLRVCGMVKNEGEPGGGPYIINEKDGSTSLQILEEAQIDKSNTNSISALKKATHFNPVDLVCATKDYKGNKFNLFNYTDPATGFISQKSHEGVSIKAQELPGLWNGAMSNWNTQFIEVPLITFNPVKTVLDLLRDTHL